MDIELRYWPHNKPIPEGWERHDGLDDTHHGDHACLLVKKPVSIAEACDHLDRAEWEETISEMEKQDDLCICGKPKQEPIPEGSHTVTPCCRQVVSGCCGDV
jgi:hypothetical protein